MSARLGTGPAPVLQRCPARFQTLNQERRTIMSVFQSINSVIVHQDNRIHLNLFHLGPSHRGWLRECRRRRRRRYCAPPRCKCFTTSALPRGHHLLPTLAFVDTVAAARELLWEVARVVSPLPPMALDGVSEQKEPFGEPGS